MYICVWYIILFIHIELATHAHSRTHAHTHTHILHNYYSGHHSIVGYWGSNFLDPLRGLGESKGLARDVLEHCACLPQDLESNVYRDAGLGM